MTFNFLFDQQHKCSKKNTKTQQPSLMTHKEGQFLPKAKEKPNRCMRNPVHAVLTMLEYASL